MAVPLSRTATSLDRFLRPFVPILAGIVVAIVFLYLGSLGSNIFRDASSPVGDAINGVQWIPYLLVAGLMAYALSVIVGEPDLWNVGQREVIAMVVGAVIYGVMSYATNIVQIPSIALISLRPAIVTPIFFGMVFGPAVGFFTGFAGNILGDTLTGWGVYPVWEIGNGMIGLFAGLMLGFRSSRASLNILTAIVVVVNVALSALMLIYPEAKNTLTGEAVGGAWWVPLVIALLSAGVRWLLDQHEELVIAEMWGALAIIIGVGFAAIADSWWSGYTLLSTLLGQFAPASSANLINALILLPVLLGAWKMLQSPSAL